MTPTLSILLQGGLGLVALFILAIETDSGMFSGTVVLPAMTMGPLLFIFILVGLFQNRKNNLPALGVTAGFAVLNLITVFISYLEMLSDERFILGLSAFLAALSSVVLTIYTLLKNKNNKRVPDVANNNTSVVNAPQSPQPQNTLDSSLHQPEN